MSRIKWLLIPIMLFSLAFTYGEISETILNRSTYELENVISNVDEAERIYENDNYVYYFKDARDVLIIEDKSNGYTWKSGLDIASAKSVKAALRKDELLGYEPLEQKMNEIFTGIGNSLIVLEYYDDSLGIKRLASAAIKGAKSTLKQVSDEANHFVLDIAYEEMDIKLKVHILLTEKGYDIRINHEDIEGEDQDRIAAIMLNPFLGASGGKHAIYDKETDKHGDYVSKDLIEGYVLVPDGPGALIEFSDYNVSMIEYSSRIYGQNLAKDTYHETIEEIFFVPFKNPKMPVYGVAHTNYDAAFVGYASEGDNFMEIIVMPEENTTLYTWAYPRFVVNETYYQVFNKRGEGYFTLFDEPNTFDIEFHYEFLSNENANYSGMAIAYRDVLFETNTLQAKTSSETMPIRLDFVMSDQKKSVVGYENVVVTSARDVDEILEDLNKNGINGITTGLLGWQDGGITIGKPWDANWLSEMGSSGDFKDLIENHYQVDISFQQNYVNIADQQVDQRGNALKHMSNWYLHSVTYDDVPFTEFYYARPDKSVEWLNKQVDKLSKIGIQSHTIDGMSSMLLTDHGNDPLNEDEVIEMYRETLASLDIPLNLVEPNQYLWQYTDRYLQAPVDTTRYLIETDTVPFLQMVLDGSMDVFGPYSNFSFSDEKDILKMIDFNVYPSFLLTKEPSYLLSNTNSLDFYSTEYVQYDNLIMDTYNTVEKALGAVMDTIWIKHEKIDDDVYVNTYENGTKIVLNYGDQPYDYNGETVNAVDFKIVK